MNPPKELTDSQRFELENLETFRERPAGFDDRCVLHDRGLIRGTPGRRWELTDAGRAALEVTHGAG